MKDSTLISIITLHVHKLMLSQTMGRFKVCTYNVVHDNRISPHASRRVLMHYIHYPSVPNRLELN